MDTVYQLQQQQQYQQGLQAEQRAETAFAKQHGEQPNLILASRQDSISCRPGGSSRPIWFGKPEKETSEGVLKGVCRNFICSCHVLRQYYAEYEKLAREDSRIRRCTPSRNL